MAIVPLFANHVGSLAQQVPAPVIPWACPVPYFGRAMGCTVASVGINPSNLEFTDVEGRELTGEARRLPTLESLGLRRWADTDSQHLRHMIARCDDYFSVRPYDRWFGVLERILRRASLSYYGNDASAAHIDLVPFATRHKWGSLAPSQRRRLLNDASEDFGLLVRSTSARILILNGKSVVDAFETCTEMRMASSQVPAWELPRSTRPVAGVAFEGVVEEIAGVPLGRRVKVLGFNHNLQSSFGVTSQVREAIGGWLASRIAGQL